MFYVCLIETKSQIKEDTNQIIEETQAISINVFGAGVGGSLEGFTLLLDKCNPKFESKNIMLEFSPLTLAPC